MKVGLSTLRVLLEHNVLEIKFNRRNPKPNTPGTRRMLCTNSPVVLKSDAGKQTLRYEQSSGSAKYSPTSKNLVLTWDIFKQGYRTVSCENVQIINQIPISGDGREFWEYFNSTIYPMTPQQKEAFFNV